MVVLSDAGVISSSVAGADQRVAVLLMGYGEVESYEDFANYNEQALNLLTAKFAPVPAWVYPPLARLLAMFDRHEWGHQHHDFISPHNKIFEEQRAGIEAQLKHHWGEQVTVFKAFNFCAPYLPKQVLAEIQAQGFERLLIYPLLVVDSIFTSGIAVEQVNAAISEINTELEAHQGGAWLPRTRYIPSFFNRPDYIQLLAQIVETQIQSQWLKTYAPSQIGIVLMNHGCPHKAKGFTSGISESQALYESVREELIYRYPLISVGWLNHDTPLIEWTQPDVTQASQNLIQLGAKVILFMPIGFATENHETLLDVHHIIHGLEKQHPDVSYDQMPCVNAMPEFLDMVAAWAEPHISALMAPEPTAQLSHSGHSHNGHHHHHHH
ncbi:ferrochelatase [Thermosynechococcaceae cyanobacterium BACA0444]|uniref:coproporphyrin ferrochelatase n=1 Tax=Pseudocalidococcus azoricus BACA0444 TaxID=2918990 RepID=A0AAE4FVH9_9CYAN|nr:ferrochelatase [Pseudocalidococcus azoricus]MDS3861816.1 ferrochelatase [Pseudocalidococcus azoricus BACA0444]